ncbi:MAG: transcriptional repressor [Candidatus Micrarchaeota archaeon]
MRTTRKTRQKSLMLEEMGKLERLFTPDELYGCVRARLPGVGIATVYRFLKRCAKDGQAHRYRHGRAWVYSVHAKSDAHFICERCGKMRHLDLAGFDLGGVMKKERGVSACHFQLDVFGVCEKCRQETRR